MKSLLAVFAHPDDETAIAGTLSHYADLGVHIGLVCITKGEAGEISAPELATPDTLPKVRERELRCSCQAIGIQELIMLGYCDSGMQGTPENEKATAFIRAAAEDVQKKLVRVYRNFKPEVVITFEPFGWYGHPDHVETGKHATAAFDLAGSPGAFPESGPIWQPKRLFHAVLPRSGFAKMVAAAREQNIDLGGFEDIAFDKPNPAEAAVTHEIEVDHKLELFHRLLDCHQTQFGPDHLFRRLPVDLMQDLWSREHFVQVCPALPKNQVPLTDLFAGLDDG